MKSTDKLQLKEKSLKIAIISFNMANKSVSKTDIDKLIHTIYNKELDAIIVSTQEEINNSKKTLAKKMLERMNQIKKDETAKIVHSSHFTTFTTAFGQVGLTILAPNKTDFQFECSDSYTHRGGKPKLLRNKGGIITRMRINGVKITAVGAHLDSGSDVEKVRETRRLFSKIEGCQDGFIHTWDVLENIADEFLFFIGDLNYRNIHDNKTSHGLDPFFNTLLERLPTQHLKHHNLTCCRFENGEKGVTYNGHNNFSKQKLPLEKDTKKKVGGSDRNYLDVGKTDRILYRSIANNKKDPLHYEAKIVEDTQTSDHAPICAFFDMPLQTLTSFERVKRWVAKVIEPFASSIVVKNILDANESDKDYILAAFNYYNGVKSIKNYAEQLYQANRFAVCTIFNGVDPKQEKNHFELANNYSGFVPNLEKAGDVFFQNKCNLHDIDKKQELIQSLNFNHAIALKLLKKVKETKTIRQVVTNIIFKMENFIRGYFGLTKIKTTLHQQLSVPSSYTKWSLFRHHSQIKKSPNVRPQTNFLTNG